MNTTACAKCKMPIKGCKDHSHEDWEIVLQLEGNATVIFGELEIEATPGTVMVIPPNIVHRNYSENFYTDMYLQARHLDFNDIIVIQDIDNNILTLMSMLHKTMTENEENIPQLADKLTELICVYIHRISKTDMRYPFVNKLKNIMYSNLSNVDFSIEQQMKELGYQPDYFRRCFKKITGMTPLEYLTKLRINQAKVLLEQNNFVSIEHVANNCGFADSFYFSKCFKRYVGIPPREYRKNCFNGVAR